MTGGLRAHVMIAHTYFDLKLLHGAWKEIVTGLPLSSNISELWSVCLKVLDRDPIETLALDVAAHIAERGVTEEG